MMFLMCLLFGAGTFFCGIKTIQAQEKIVYTMKKGSSKTIKKLLKNHPFTKNNLAKYRNLTWKSTKPKVIEVKANRKLIAKKKGKAYLRGYDKKKKKVVGAFHFFTSLMGFVRHMRFRKSKCGMRLLCRK